MIKQVSTMILQIIHTFRLKYFIYKSTRKQALGLQSTDFMGHIFINNLQHFKLFHHQSTPKIWPISTVYKKGTPPPTKTKTNKMKTVNVAVDWSPNLHDVANGGHGSSLEYHHGAFVRSLKILSQWIHGGLVLRSVIFFFIFLLVGF